MAIFRGVGGSGDSSDNSFLQAVTEQAEAAEQSKLGAQNALTFALSSASAASTSASAASASASSILNLTAATGNAGTDASYNASTGVLTVPRGDTGATAPVTTANVTAAGALMDSEVTNLAQVKAFDSSDYATAAQGTTANNALPKAGGQMTGNITFSGTQTVDGRDVSVDGTKLDTLERVYRRRFLKHAYNYTISFATLTSGYSVISPTINGTSNTGSENELDLHITAIHYDINTANEFVFYVNLVAPYPPAEDTVNLGTVSDVSGTTTSIRTFAVSGDITKHLSPYCGMSTTSTGANAFGLDINHSWYYDVLSNKTIMTTYNYQSSLPSNGDTLYLHPFDWESSGVQLTGDFYPADAYNASGTVNIRRDYKFYLGYHKNAPSLRVYAKETTGSENIAITAVGGVLTQYQD